MPTLKEIKGRISSVQNTLKITSAMKLVSSAKLRKAQVAIEAMRPYEAQLQRILELVRGKDASMKWADFMDRRAQSAAPSTEWAENEDAVKKQVVIIAMASNSSLCGGFNANIIAKAKELLKEYPHAVVYSVGRKMADAMRKAGYPSPVDYSALSERPSFGPASALAGKLMEDYQDGKVERVFLVYNHFVTAAKQLPVVEQFLPVCHADAVCHSERSEESASAIANLTHREADVILEPDAKALLEALVPKTIKLKLYAALLDNAAAEHAARTIAMQTATDNGEDLLGELTLQYNKGRQQKITAEILDLAGGQL
jgi:F-type H+-transporting ATPase subunit gamma